MGITLQRLKRRKIEDVEFRTKKFLLDAMKQGLIPERWSDIDSERIWIAYKTREDVQLDFYSKKQLERISNNRAIGIGLLTSGSEWRYSVIEAAGEDWTKEIEIELFSAHIMSR
ncbi:MAG: hypothetical protein Q4C46_01450 [Bacillota bacterium]|nr:hypothetical protein [Bacillota bacterium]